MFAGEKTHPGWSPARFDPMHRAKANVREVSALVLDYDNPDGSKVAVTRVAEVWGQVYGLVHTSKRHTPTAPRWRIVLVLSRLVTPEEHARLWTWAAAEMRHMGVVVDASTRDASRFWFWPCRAEGGHFETRRLDGACLPVDHLLRYLDHEREREARRPHPTTADPSQATNDAEYAQAALRRGCEALAHARPGERNNTAAREAYALGGFVAAGLLDASEVARELRQATRRGGWERGDERRTHATITRQLKEGAETTAHCRGSARAREYPRPRRGAE
ncbi:MAG: hypothetical protein R3B70_20675 [Polyangiaceae bacterium]